MLYHDLDRAFASSPLIKRVAPIVFEFIAARHGMDAAKEALKKRGIVVRAPTESELLSKSKDRNKTRRKPQSKRRARKLKK
jgi:hypothetical protein